MNMLAILSLILSFISLATVFLFILLNKDKEQIRGPTGPMGPTGPTGPMGPTGSSGNTNAIKEEREIVSIVSNGKGPFSSSKYEFECKGGNYVLHISISGFSMKNGEQIISIKRSRVNDTIANISIPIHDEMVSTSQHTVFSTSQSVYIPAGKYYLNVQSSPSIISSESDFINAVLTN